jgi:V8-like Glu-specific endopeptidase
MRLMLVGVVALAITTSAGELAQTEDDPGFNQHYGEIGDPSVWPISAVGAVTIALHSRRSTCTGTLVAPKLVLTAAHCLFTGELSVSSDNVRFLAGLNKGVPAEHSIAQHLMISKGFTPGPPTQERIANDWAVIVLDNAISTKPIPIKAITRDQFPAVSHAVSIGYGRDRLYLPSIIRDCPVSEGSDDRIFKHRCLTNFGYSGAPILANIDNTSVIIGINSTGDPQRRVGMACSATQFARIVAELTQSE